MPTTPSSRPAVTDRPSDLDSVIRGRASVRKLLPDLVPAELIRSAIAAAGWAPSPHGRQPWRFVVIEQPETKAHLAQSMADSWQEQLELDRQNDAIVAIRLAKSQERIITAPAILIACLYLADLDTYPDPDRQRAETTMAIQSLGAAIQNALLTIYAAGYDAGWMCAPLFAPDVVRAALDLAPDLIPHAMIPIGKRAADPVRRPRLPIDDLIAAWH